MTNFAEELAAAAAESRHRPAVKLDDLVLTYALLDAGVARAAGLLRAQGIRPATASGCSCRTSPTSPSSTSARCASARSWCR